MPARSVQVMPLTEATHDDPIFSSDSSEVEPPFLVSRVPPGIQVLGASDSGRQFLEVLVDRAGGVEYVRLLGGNAVLSSRQQTLLDAARRWQFTPARREGQPVRYSLRLSVAP